MQINSIGSQMACRKPCPANRQQAGTNVKFGYFVPNDYEYFMESCAKAIGSGNLSKSVQERLECFHSLVKSCTERLKTGHLSKSERCMTHKKRGMFIWKICRSGELDRNATMCGLTTATWDLHDALPAIKNQKVLEFVKGTKLMVRNLYNKLMYNYIKEDSTTRSIPEIVKEVLKG